MTNFRSFLRKQESCAVGSIEIDDAF